MSLRSQRREDTRRRIKSAARSLFLERGVADTSMDALAELAGVSRATLFNYFPGKSVLLDALAADLEERLLGALDHYRRKHVSPAQVLSALFGHAAQVLEQTTDLTRLLFMHSSAAEGLPALQAAFVQLAAAGQQSGDWRADIERTDLGEILYLGFVAGLLGWCLGPGESPGEALSRRADSLGRILRG